MDKHFGIDTGEGWRLTPEGVRDALYEQTEEDMMGWLLAFMALMLGRKQSKGREPEHPSSDDGVEPPRPWPLLPVRGAWPTRRGRMFGFRRSPTHVHQGVDLFAPLGTPVYAPENAVAVRVVREYAPGFSGYGKVLILKAKSTGLYLFFSHLDNIHVVKGGEVLRGEIVASVGTTAYRRSDPEAHFRTSEPHVHFEVSKATYPQDSEAPRLDPAEYFAGELNVPRRG